VRAFGTLEPDDQDALANDLKVLLESRNTSGDETCLLWRYAALGLRTRAYRDGRVDIEIPGNPAGSFSRRGKTPVSWSSV
jgi:hypothetical protein